MKWTPVLIGLLGVAALAPGASRAQMGTAKIDPPPEEPMARMMTMMDEMRSDMSRMQQQMEGMGPMRDRMRRMTTMMGDTHQMMERHRAEMRDQCPVFKDSTPEPKK
jgi:hypothetical protein